MTMLVAIDGWSAEPWRDRLAALLPGRPVVLAGDAFDPADVEYALVWKPRPGLLASLPRLKAIFSLGAGVDHVINDPTLPDVPLVRVVDPDLTARMSEWVVLHALFHLRAMPRLIDRQRRARWDEGAYHPSARDVRVGVMGTGVLGRDAMAKLAVMGFQVAGWSRSEKPGEAAPSFHGAQGLGPFLARTDILVALVPLTAATRGILNIGLFRRLAQGGRLGGPVLLNPGRGGLQVEADILAALDEGSLAAASLDVFETEPLPASSPLWAHPRITITPHNAAVSDPDAISRYIVGQIVEREAGRPLRNLVDRTAGY